MIEELALVLWYCHNGQSDKLKTMKASPHFTWSELLVHRTNKELKTIRPANIRRLKLTALHMLEPIREYLGGRPILITSGWRDMGTQQRLIAGGKGATYSQHPLGNAFDFVVPSLSHKEVQSMLDAVFPGRMGYGRTFTHVDSKDLPLNEPLELSVSGGKGIRFNYS